MQKVLITIATTRKRFATCFSTRWDRVCAYFTFNTS